MYQPERWFIQAPPTIRTTDNSNNPVSSDEMVVCNLLAHAYNTQNTAFLEMILADDLLYSSQWVLEEMRGKQVYLDYLSAKFKTIMKSGSAIFAELASYRGQYCLVIAQGSKANPVATMLVKTQQGKISEIHMCEVPHFTECERLGIYPKD